MHTRDLSLALLGAGVGVLSAVLVLAVAQQLGLNTILPALASAGLTVYASGSILWVVARAQGVV